MGERQTLDPADLPTLRQLSVASVAAVAIAVVLGITAVLPAELGIDPTGVGKTLGLTELGLMKQRAEEVTPEVDPTSAERSDTLSLTLQPGQGAEIKAAMRLGDTMNFLWVADNGPLFFEFHGDETGKPASDFTSYEKATKQRSEGIFEAAFDGKHGWYWKNRTRQPITVQLTTRGVYQSIAKQ
jgi:hypothetical protein